MPRRRDCGPSSVERRAAVEAEISTAATEDGHASTNPRLSIKGDPGYAAPKAELMRPLLPLAMSLQQSNGPASSANEPETNGPTAPA